MNRFPKKSGTTRILRGKLVFTEGKACLAIDEKQGNSVLSSAIGADLLAVIPAGSGPMEAGSVLRGFRITD
jgi:molybdopterin molybdotransferase